MLRIDLLNSTEYMNHKLYLQYKMSVSILVQKLARPI